ncbi:MAG: hypothetical protein AAGF89_16035 [Bacteroidota bacterium]
MHPLLLAIGSERYMPFREKVPEEIITQANRILGSGQTSLAKYCIIAADEDDPALDADDQPAFFQHVLERFDPTRDLHFQTRTTIDTLDYSGSGWNAGSKLIWACRGAKKRELTTTLPGEFSSLPEGFAKPIFVAPGILAVEGPPFTSTDSYADLHRLTSDQQTKAPTDQSTNQGVAAGAILGKGLALVIICDDSPFLAEDFSNFVWATFTRSNPSHDIHGFGAFMEHKHWGCTGPVVIDARIKPWHAPGLVPDSTVSERVDNLLAGIVTH